MTAAQKEPLPPGRVKRSPTRTIAGPRAWSENPGSWNHRCFHISPRKEKGWVVRNLYVGLTPRVPFKFSWLVREDREGLRRYIDALLMNRAAEAAQIEATGIVTDIEHDTTPHPENTLIRVNIKRLVDLLLLRDHFDIPLWGRVKFITNGNNTLVPSEFIAAMVKILGEDGAHIDPSAPWQNVSEDDLKRMGIKPEDVTSGMYRNRQTASAERMEEQTSPREERIRLTHHEKHFEIVTQTFPDGAKPFFTRRLMLYGGKQLWVGTSFSSEGPWHVWERATSELLALGLSPDE